MTTDTSAYQWGSRTARIATVCRATQLLAAVGDETADVRWGALVDAARLAAARYQAPPPFVDGYVDGALCVLWRSVGWDRALRLGERVIEAPEPDWWAEWPREADADYDPIFPLGLVL